MVSEAQLLELASGRFAGTTRDGLKAAFDAIIGDAAKPPLVVHFHGGLVDRAKALEIAGTLDGVYGPAGAWPLFVVWRTGLFETLRINWQEIAREEIFPLLLERASQFVLGKLGERAGSKGLSITLPDRLDIKREIEAKTAAGEEPFAEREDELGALDPGLSSVQEDQIERIIRGDHRLNAAAAGLARPTAPRLAPAIEAEAALARRGAQAGEKGILSTAFLIKAAVAVVARCLLRLARGRGHGIYATIVEEVARELKGDQLARIIWSAMKIDAAQAFAETDEAGGAALVAEMGRLHGADPGRRIILVGHSAGAIHIAELLRHAAKTDLPPGLGFELVFLAPACTFQLIDQALDAAGERVKAFRSFAMEDELEKKDAILKPLYLRSLLYFVSGLAEDEVDAPLLGMQRYFSGASPFDAAGVPEIARVRERLDGFDHAWNWSLQEAGPGRTTLGRKHGDFDNETKTLESVAHLIRSGFVA